MKKFLFIFILTVFSGTAIGAMPIVKATGQGHAYSSKMQAVRNALLAASVKYTSEYGGIVYKLNGKYYYTRPVTVDEDSEVHFEVLMLRSARLVALYHTHTPGRDSGLFSQCDIEVANQLHVPSYILVLDKSEIKSYTPGVNKTFEFGGGVFSGITKASRGTLVAQLAPLKNVGAYLE